IGLIASIDPWSAQVRRGLPRVAFFVALAQVCIGLVEWRGGMEVARFFWAGNFTIGSVGTQIDTLATVQDRIVAGTMSHYNIYAITLVFCIGIMVVDLLSARCMSWVIKSGAWAVVGASTVAVLLSQSRQAVLALAAAAVALGVHVWMRSARRESGAYVPKVALALIAVLLIAVASGRLPVGDRFGKLMQPGYWADQATRDRGYAITAVAPEVLTEVPLFGAGPGSFHTVAKDSEGAIGVARFGLDPKHSKYIGDVGWVLFAVQIGLIGLAFILAMFWLLLLAGRMSPGVSGALYWWFAVALAVGMLASAPLIYKPPSVMIWAVLGLAAQSVYGYSHSSAGPPAGFAPPV
ncbi:MAG: hypothetical protein L6413_03955, partial [Coriobacteriia bacterium]|nr:hypothetical protein [Coriobacteriia bacterium]